MNKVMDWCLGAVLGSSTMAMFGIAIVMILLGLTGAQHIVTMPQWLQPCGIIMGICATAGSVGTVVFGTLYGVLLGVKLLRKV